MATGRIYAILSVIHNNIHRYVHTRLQPYRDKTPAQTKEGKERKADDPQGWYYTTKLVIRKLGRREETEFRNRAVWCVREKHNVGYNFTNSEKSIS